MKTQFDLAASYIKEAKYVVAFTGAGISVESGIPPFRGENGLWNKYDPDIFLIDKFLSKPKEIWKSIREIFYDMFGNVKPNAAHIALAKMEEKGFLKCVITQNIDNLHQEAGSKVVHEFHGNLKKLVCMKTGKKYSLNEVDLTQLPPMSKDGGLLKPDIIFFGETIPQDAYHNSLHAAENADVLLVIGTTGEVMPASMIPTIARRNGAKIIEVNTEKSKFTDTITDIFLRGTATEVMSKLQQLVLGE